MKKKWFYLATILALTSCAEDAFEDGSSQDASIPQEIKLSAGTRGIEVASRGKGSVGSGNNENQWNQEVVTVYCFKRGITTFDTSKESESNIYLNGAKAKTGTSSNESTLAFLKEDGTPTGRYYPLQNAYDFVGYYADDDASIGTINTSTSGQMEIPVTITGSQDLMIAKADLSYDDKKILVKELITGGKLNNTTTTEDVSKYIVAETGEPRTDNNLTENQINTIKNEYAKAFSSYTARRGIQPNMVFEHQLVRLNFKVKAGDENTIAKIDANDPTKKLGVYIKEIKVGSRNQGNIIIKNDGTISFAPTSTTTTDLLVGSISTDASNAGQVISLVETGDQLATTQSFEDNEADPVGTGLLVMEPMENSDGTKSYTAQITAVQYYNKDGNAIPSNEQQKVYSNVKIQNPIKDDVVQQFLPGRSYDITITVYSNQSIEIKATLTGWEDGGSIEINPEDDAFKS